MTARPALTALAVATSARPGALSILDAAPGPASPAAAPRFWADPAALEAATLLLRDSFGFAVTHTSRIGVHFSAFPDDLERLFAVTLTADDGDSGLRWRITDAAGAATPVIRPVTEAQRACLRGIRIDAPSRPNLAPLNVVPSVEAAQLRSPSAYQVLPHQLRTQLSGTLRDSDAVDTLPRGRGVQVHVIDTGWKPNGRAGDAATAHPYWAAAGLATAASGANVTLVQDTANFQTARAMTLAILAGFETYLTKLPTDPRLAAPNPAAVPPETVAQYSARVLKVLTTDKPVFQRIAAVLPQVEVMKVHTDALTGVGTASALAPIRSMVTAFLEEAALWRILVGNAIHQMPTAIPEDVPHGPSGTPSAHGTAVVGQLIAVAPEARVTVHQATAGNAADLFPPVLLGEGPYLGKDANALLLEVAEQPLANARPEVGAPLRQILSYSFSRNHNFSTTPTNAANLAAANTALTEFGTITDEMSLNGMIGFFSTTNRRTDATDPASSSPPQVDLQSRSPSRAVVLVGSAAWAARDTRLRLSPSDAVGYRDGPVISPQICGLSGRASRVGVSVVPVFDAGGAPIYAAVSGTSFATPQVAGVAAVVLGILGAADREVLRHVLTGTMVKIPDGNGDFSVPDWATSVLALTEDQGRPGLADLWAAVEEARAIIAAEADVTAHPRLPVPPPPGAAAGGGPLPLPLQPLQPLVPTRPPPPPPGRGPAQPAPAAPLPAAPFPPEPPFSILFADDDDDSLFALAPAPPDLSDDEGGT